MQSDKLLKQFQEKGLKSKSTKTSTLDGLKKNKAFQPIDSGKLISLKGGTGDDFAEGPIRGN